MLARRFGALPLRGILVRWFPIAAVLRFAIALASFGLVFVIAGCSGDDDPPPVNTGGTIGGGGESGSGGSGGATFAGRPGEVTFVNCSTPATVHTLGTTVSSSTPRVALVADPTRDDVIGAGWLNDNNGVENVRYSRFAADNTLLDALDLTTAGLTRRAVDLVRLGHQLVLGYINNDDGPFQVFTRTRDDTLNWTPVASVSDVAAPAQNLRLAALSAASGYSAVWTTKVNSSSPLQLMVGRLGADGKLAAAATNITPAEPLIHFGLGSSPMGQELGAPVVYTTQDSSGTTASLWLRDVDKDGTIADQAHAIAEGRSFIGEPVAVRVLPNEALVAWTESLLSGTEYLARVHVRRLRFATNGPDYGSERILTLGYVQSRAPTFAALPGVIALAYETVDEQGARAIVVRMITRDGDIGTEPTAIYAVPADAELGALSVRESYDFQAFAVAWVEAASAGAQRFAKLALVRCIQ